MTSCPTHMRLVVVTLILLDGRPLYEALGFAATNEMRFAGGLASWSRPIER